MQLDPNPFKSIGMHYTRDQIKRSFGHVIQDQDEESLLREDEVKVEGKQSEGEG